MLLPCRLAEEMEVDEIDDAPHIDSLTSMPDDEQLIPYDMPPIDDVGSSPPKAITREDGSPFPQWALDLFARLVLTWQFCFFTFLYSMSRLNSC